MEVDISKIILKIIKEVEYSEICKIIILIKGEDYSEIIVDFLEKIILLILLIIIFIEAYLTIMLKVTFQL